MKTLMLLLGAMLISFAGISQPNNPYNKRGIDFQTSLNIIQTDFYAGKVKVINDETITRYLKIIPLTAQADMKLANQVISSIKDPGYNFQNALKRSRLSGFGKEVMNTVLNPKKLDLRDFQKQLTKMTDEISQASIDATEKEFLYTVVAVTYNMARTEKTERSCYIEGIYGNTDVPCWVAGAVQGAVIGYDNCGMWCAIGGAVVGAVSGAFS